MLKAVMALGAMLLPAAAVWADEEPLAPVVYHGSVSLTSQRTAYVELVTGEVKRHRIDEDILPHWITKGSWESRHPSLEGTFGTENDEQFVESFVSELVHLGLFRQAVETNGGKSEDVHIRLSFVRSEYFPTHYVLDVEMQIEDERSSSSKRYLADSRNARSLIKGDLYGRALLKAAAATDLMDKLIPDVEEWLRQDQAARDAGETPAPTQDH